MVAHIRDNLCKFIIARIDTVQELIIGSYCVVIIWISSLKVENMSSMPDCHKAPVKMHWSLISLVEMVN